MIDALTWIEITRRRWLRDPRNLRDDGTLHAVLLSILAEDTRKAMES